MKRLAQTNSDAIFVASTEAERLLRRLGIPKAILAPLENNSNYSSAMADARMFMKLKADRLPDRKRRGLSLIEVLISMFVLTIGLLSVASLVPVGQSEMVKGGIADRTSAMGQSAYHDIRIRGFLNPGSDAEPQLAEADGTWIKAPPVDTANPPDLNMTKDRLYLDEATGRVVIAISKTAHKPAAIAVDPSFIAETAANGTVMEFPYDGPADGMKRVTRLALKTTPAATISKELAREVFYSKDDLMIDAPADEEDAAIEIDFSGTKTLVPQQARGGSFGPTGDPYFDQGDTAADFKKRLYDQKYSWLFTLVPMGESRNMRMSIVIFRNRLLEKNAVALDPEGPINERSVEAVFTSDGRSGDTLTLSHPEAVSLDFKSGTWIMLYGVYDNKTPTNQSDDQYLSFWHRVINAGDTILDSSKTPPVYNREATTQGADWDLANWGQPKAGIFEGVVSVFEKTVQAEGNSPWSQ